MAPLPVTEQHPISVAHHFNPNSLQQYQQGVKELMSSSAPSAGSASAAPSSQSGTHRNSSGAPNLSIQPPLAFEDKPMPKNFFDYGLNRPSSLNQINNQHQMLPQNAAMAGSFYQFPSTSTSVQSNPQFPTLQRYPSVARVNSFTNLNMLFGDDNSGGGPSMRSPTNAGGSGSFSFAPDGKTLMPTNSYLCMKSFIEDGSTNGIQPLSHNGSHNALQQLLDEERRRCGSGGSPGIGPFNGMLSQSLRASRLSQCSIPNFSPNLPTLSPSNASVSTGGGNGSDSEAVAKAMNSLVRTASSGRLLGGAEMIAAAAAASAAASMATRGGMHNEPLMPAVPKKTSKRASTKVSKATKSKQLKRKQAPAGAADGVAKVRRVSEYRGVSFHSSSGNWRARIKVHGNSKHLGYFKDEHEAAVAYDKAAFDLFGDKAPNNNVLREANMQRMGLTGASAAAVSGSVASVAATKTKTKAKTTSTKAKAKGSATSTNRKSRTPSKNIATKQSKKTKTSASQQQKATRASMSPQYKDDSEAEAVMAWDGSIDDLINMKPRNTNLISGGTGASALKSEKLGTPLSMSALQANALMGPAKEQQNDDDIDSIGDADDVANVKIPLDIKDANWNL